MLRPAKAFGHGAFFHTQIFFLVSLKCPRVLLCKTLKVYLSLVPRSIFSLCSNLRFTPLQKERSTRWVLLSFWRRQRDSNPRGLSPKRFSRPPRYDRFDMPPYILLCGEMTTQMVLYHIISILTIHFLKIFYFFAHILVLSATIRYKSIDRGGKI